MSYRAVYERSYSRSDLPQLLSTTMGYRYRQTDLPQLIIKTLSYQENVNRESIEAALRSGELRVPPEVRYSLWMDDPQSVPYQQVGIIRRIQQKFHWMNKRFRAPTSIPDPRLETVAAYLESILEDGYDS